MELVQENVMKNMLKSLVHQLRLKLGNKKQQPTIHLVPLKDFGEDVQRAMDRKARGWEYSPNWQDKVLNRLLRNSRYTETEVR